MKVVQFRDGRYGIRKLTIFGYKFLGKDNSENYWWGMKEFIPLRAAMSKDAVINRWNLLKKSKIIDNGKVVKLTEIGE